MKAIILAAGRGSRMRAMTEDRPKCLVELMGRSLLSLQLAALKEGGVRHVGIVTGYRAEMLARPGLTMFNNPRWSSTNMVMSLYQVTAWLCSEPCLVSYADIFYPSETVRRLIDAPGDIVVAYDPDWLTLWKGRFENPLADAETFSRAADGRVTKIGQRAQDYSEIEGQYMGLLKFTPAGWTAVEKFLQSLEPAALDKMDMTGMLSRLIAGGTRIDSVATAPGWGEVDAETDLDFYKREIAAGRIRLIAEGG